MLAAAGQIYFKIFALFFVIGPIGSLVWVCVILAGLAWAYRRVEPLTPMENWLGIIAPKIWVLISFLASFKIQSYGLYVLIFGFWVYTAYAIALIFSLRRIRILTFFSSLLFLSLIAGIGWFGIAMTGEL